MNWLDADGYVIGRLLVTRGIAALYLVAFLAALLQFRALIGERGMLPVPEFVRDHPFRSSPSLFHWRFTDRTFAAVATIGAILAALTLVGVTERLPLIACMFVWFALWAAYLSIVNVGQIWYSFGWESLLLEAGVLAIFLGNAETAPQFLVLIMVRWLLFRVEFGAGLIKWRGDRCWRDLTCLYYHHETQPMPGPLSRWFHQLPRPLHRMEVAGNHVTQLVVPFALFTPQPGGRHRRRDHDRDATVAGAQRQFRVVELGHHRVGVLGVARQFLLRCGHPGLRLRTHARAVHRSGSRADRRGRRSQCPARAEPDVEAAGDECVVQPVALRQHLRRVRQHYPHPQGGDRRGTTDSVVTPATEWLEYEFKGKPGDVLRRPRQCAPYHRRLDWLMWFAAISRDYAVGWFPRFAARLLDNDPDTLRLLRHNPFPDVPPALVRARVFRYRYSTSAEYHATGAWWCVPRRAASCCRCRGWTLQVSERTHHNSGLHHNR